MSDVMIYHPVTEATASVPAEAVPHHRMSGWLLLSEHQANQEQAAAAADQPAAKAAKASKPESEGK